MSRHPNYIRLINSTKWRRLRLLKLQSQPLCECCLKEGRRKLAEEVHHIVEVESATSEDQMEVMMYDMLNLMSVCHECHVRIHKEAFSHTKEAVKANNKRKTEQFIDRYLRGPDK